MPKATVIPPLPDALAHLAAWHGDDLRETIGDLLNGVPAKGGKVTRADLETLVQEAFIGGVVSQIANPVIR